MQGRRPEHLTGEADPAGEYVRIFDDDGTSNATLESKLQELCTYLLAFEERGEVFGRRNDRRIMECLAKRLAALSTTQARAAATRDVVSPSQRPTRRGRGRGGGRGGATSAEVATSAAPPQPPSAPTARNNNVVELLCRACWTYEEVTELHFEEGAGPLLAEEPLRALLDVLAPQGGASHASQSSTSARASRGKQPKGKQPEGSPPGGPEEEEDAALPPAPPLDPGRRLAAEEAVKLLMLLGQVRRGGSASGGGGRDILIRHAFPGTGGLEARRVVTRLGGLATLAGYTRSCYASAHAAAAVDALTLMHGLCQTTRERPDRVVVRSLLELVANAEAAALHAEALRCLASLVAACGDNEGAMLCVIRGGLPGTLAKVLGCHRVGADEVGTAGDAEGTGTDAWRGRETEPSSDGSPAPFTTVTPSCVMDVGARLMLWLCSSHVPRVFWRCFREGALELLADPNVIARACGSGNASTAMLLLQTCERALEHLFGPEPDDLGVTPKPDGKGKGSETAAGGDASISVSRRGGRGKAEARDGEEGGSDARARPAQAQAGTHHGLSEGDRVRDMHSGAHGEIVALLSRGRCLVDWEEEDDEEDDEEEDDDEDGLDELDMDDDIIEHLHIGQSEVPSEYLVLVSRFGEGREGRGGGGGGDARSGGGDGGGGSGAEGVRGLFGFSRRVGSSLGSGWGGGNGALLPGAREFWIGAGSFGSTSGGGSTAANTPAVSAAEASALQRAEASVPRGEARATLAASFASRLLRALLSAQREMAHEGTKRLLLRLVTRLLRLTPCDTPLNPRDFAGVLALLSTTLSDGQSAGLVGTALQLADLLVSRDAANARQLQRHGLLRRVEQLAENTSDPGGGEGQKGEARRGGRRGGGGRSGGQAHAAGEPSTGVRSRARPPCALCGRDGHWARDCVDAGGGVTDGAQGEGRRSEASAGQHEVEQLAAAARLVLTSARAAADDATSAATRDVASSGGGGGCLAATAKGIAAGDVEAVRGLARRLASEEGVTEYELEEAGVAVALMHFLLGTGGREREGGERGATSEAEKAARRAAFARAFLLAPREGASSKGERSKAARDRETPGGKRRRRGASKALPPASPNGGQAAAALAETCEPTSPLARLIALLHSTVELNEQLPVYRALALGHRIAPPDGSFGESDRAAGWTGAGRTERDRGAGGWSSGLGLFGRSSGGEGGLGGGGLGGGIAKLAAGLNTLAAPLRLSLRRAPEAVHAVSDLAGAAVQALGLTPLAAVEAHVLRHAVVLDPGYRRWCEALRGATIWLWVPGVDEVDPAGDVADRRADTWRASDAENGGEDGDGSGEERRRRGGAAAEGDGEEGDDPRGIRTHDVEARGRWALATVETYNPVTGRHACRVASAPNARGPGSPSGRASSRKKEKAPPPGTEPPLQHIALVQRRYRVVSRTPAPAPEPVDRKGKRPARGDDEKPKRARDERGDDGAARSKRERRGKAPATVSNTSMAASKQPSPPPPSLYRVSLLPPDAEWDVDHFVEAHLDAIWRILGEESAKLTAAGGPSAGPLRLDPNGGGERRRRSVPGRGGLSGGRGGSGARRGGGGGGGERDAAPSHLRRRRRRQAPRRSDDEEEEEEEEEEDIVAAASDGDEEADRGAGSRAAFGWDSYAHFEDDVMEALESDAPVPVVRRGSRATCDAVVDRIGALGGLHSVVRAVSTTQTTDDDDPLAGLFGDARGASRDGHVSCPPLGARVSVRAAALSSGGSGSRPPPADPQGAGRRGGSLGDEQAEEAWLPGTVVRHRGADAVDVELDRPLHAGAPRGLQAAAVVERVRLADDVKVGEEEEARAERTANGVTGSATQPTPVEGDVAREGSSRDEVCAAVGRMLTRGLSRDAILDVLIRESGGGGGGGRVGPGEAAVALRVTDGGRGEGGNSVPVHTLRIFEGRGGGGRRGVMGGGGLFGGGWMSGSGGGSPRGGLTHGAWSGLDTSDEGRDGMRIARRDFSLDQVRRDDRRDDGGADMDADMDADVARGGHSRASGSASASRALPPPPPERCEAPPEVRVHFTLAAPDDPSAPEPGGLTPIGSAGVTRPVSKGSTLIHALRTLAARAARRTHRDRRHRLDVPAEGGEVGRVGARRPPVRSTGNPSDRPAGSAGGAGAFTADHDRFLSRCSLHYAVHVTGVPAEMASTAAEMASAEGAIAAPVRDGSSSGGGGTWSVEEVRERLTGSAEAAAARGGKLTKTAVVEALRRRYGAQALAAHGVIGSAGVAAKRVTATHLVEVYAALLAAEPGTPSVAAESVHLPAGVRASRRRAEAGGGLKPSGAPAGIEPESTSPERSSVQAAASTEDEAWALYWAVVGCQNGGTGPPDPAPDRATLSETAAATSDDVAMRAAVAAGAVFRDGGETLAGGGGRRDPPAAVAAAAVALLSVLHGWLGAPGGATDVRWENARLTRKLQHQLEDAVAVASGTLPAWTGVLLTRAKFLFPLSTRLRHFHSTAFGVSRAVTWVQEAAGAGGGVGGRDGEGGGAAVGANASLVGRTSARRLGTLRRERVTVRRASVVGDAEVLMRHHARRKSVLEVLFHGEEGYGGAVTKEFYNKVADALQLRCENARLPTWVPDEDGADGPEHLWQTRGLFPHPLLPGSVEAAAAARRFAFIGRLVGKVLLDGHILPLPIHPAFVRAAVLGETLGEDDLSAVFDARCAGGAVVQWVRRVVTHLRRERECAEKTLTAPFMDTSAEDNQMRTAEKTGNVSPTKRKRARSCAAAASVEAADAAAATDAADAADFDIAEHLEQLSYLSYACPITGHPLLCEDTAAAHAAEVPTEDEVHVGNVEAYLADVTRFWFRDGIAAQIRAFREGLAEVLPVSSLCSFSADEITELVCGRDTIEWTPEELRRCVIPGFMYTADSLPYRWLLEVLAELPGQERAAFLEFVAVCPRLPPGGLSALPRGPIKVNRMDPVDKLPEGRTCTQELRLPAYGSKEELAEKLITALQWKDYLGID